MTLDEYCFNRDMNLIKEVLEYHASAGGEYTARGTLALESFARIAQILATYNPEEK